MSGGSVWGAPLLPVGLWAGGSCPRAPELPADGSEDFKEYVYGGGDVKKTQKKTLKKNNQTKTTPPTHMAPRLLIPPRAASRPAAPPAAFIFIFIYLLAERAVCLCVLGGVRSCFNGRRPLHEGVPPTSGSSRGCGWRRPGQEGEEGRREGRGLRREGG